METGGSMIRDGVMGNVGRRLGLKEDEDPIDNFINELAKKSEDQIKKIIETLQKRWKDEKIKVPKKSYKDEIETVLSQEMRQKMVENFINIAKNTAIKNEVLNSNEFLTKVLEKIENRMMALSDLVSSQTTKDQFINGLTKAGVNQIWPSVFEEFKNKLETYKPGQTNNNPSPDISQWPKFPAPVAARSLKLKI